MEEEVSTCPICLVPFDHLQKQPHIFFEAINHNSTIMNRIL